eukprot:4942706-Pyramimonas_sp.AAC.1
MFGIRAQGETLHDQERRSAGLARPRDRQEPTQDEKRFPGKRVYCCGCNDNGHSNNPSLN